MKAFAALFLTLVTDPFRVNLQHSFPCWGALNSQYAFAIFKCQLTNLMNFFSASLFRCRPEKWLNRQMFYSDQSQSLMLTSLYVYVRRVVRIFWRCRSGYATPHRTLRWLTGYAATVTKKINHALIVCAIIKELLGRYSWEERRVCCSSTIK